MLINIEGLRGFVVTSNGVKWSFHSLYILFLLYSPFLKNGRSLLKARFIQPSKSVECFVQGENILSVKIKEITITIHSKQQECNIVFYYKNNKK